MLRSSSLQSDPELNACDISRLKLYWHPAAIAGRWNLEHPDRSLSASTIYRHINRHLLLIGTIKVLHNAGII